MNSKLKIQEAKWRTRARGLCLFFHFSFLILNSATASLATNKTPVALPGTNVPATKPEPAPQTPREFFNAGTRMLQAGKLREAEAFLQSALASQDEGLQPKALYNLGEVRFAQGIEELKKQAEHAQAAARGQRAAAQANEASQAADAALVSNDVQQMVAAYQRGRGAKKELKSATKAVKAAMEVCGNTLLKWQRAAGDFQSAAELSPADKDAAKNADIVNRHIAKLIDMIREMQQAMAAMQQAGKQLGDKLNQLKGQVPAPDAPPGGNGEEEEDEEEPGGMRPEMTESAGKAGEEKKMSAEEAGQLLNGLRRDGDKRLPMGMGEEGKSKDPKRPNW
ncbi:MAG: hypothetical protein RLY20_2039 [Verrucomicrobiota bacterium]|jgi:tetratricopeptide (TPR) repeat protein